MVTIKDKGIEFCKFEKGLDNNTIKHFITTRHGGVSKGPYKSMNMGFGTDDSALSVLENRHRLSDAVNIPLDFFVMCNQVHGDHVAIVSRQHRGMGALYKDNSLLATDAMISNESEICLFVMGADCTPLLFFDPIQKVIGAAHSGWQGTVKKIAAKTVLQMKETFRCSISDIQVGIGPSIGKCCYNVGGEVIDSVLRSFGTTEKFISFDNPGSEAHFDLWYTNKFQLMEIGVKEENIEIAGICTQCHNNDFFSSRAGNGITGRFGAGIMLK